MIDCPRLLEPSEIARVDKFIVIIALPTHYNSSINCKTIFMEMERNLKQQECCGVSMSRWLILVFY